MNSRVPALCLLMPLLGFHPFAVAAAPTTSSSELPRELSALFQSHCVKCHGTDNPKAKLSLTTPEGLSRGSKSGAILTPGKPEQSLLWKVLEEGRMPPRAPLPEADRAIVSQWIKKGAPGFTVRASQHWAFV